MKHICNPTAGFRRGKANLLMYLQWYIQGRLKPMQPMQPHWAPRRGGARGVPGGATSPPKFCLDPQWPPQDFSGLLLKVLHRPLTAPLVAKLAPPVAPQMKMSGSAPGPAPLGPRAMVFG